MGLFKEGGFMLKKKIVCSALGVVFFIVFFSKTGFSQDVKVRVIKQNAVLRVMPNPESAIIRGLPIGASLAVEETTGLWIKVKLPPGSDGIVIKGFVEASSVEFEIKPNENEKAKEGLVIPQTNVQIEKPSDRLAQSGISDSEEYKSWRKKLIILKAKTQTGEAIQYIGLGITAVFSILYWADLEEDVSYSFGYYSTTTTTKYIKKPIYLIGSIGGAAISLIAFAVGLPAEKEYKLLELEGAKKGYITASMGGGLNGLYAILNLRF
jgi:hypothetical protein